MTTIPNPNPIPNSAVLIYDYNLGTDTIPDGVNTNQVQTQINIARLDQTKTVTASYADINQIVSYTIVINNSGNVTANNVIFTDTIPTGTSFVANSLTINGATSTSNPQSGVSIGQIAANGTTTITFSVYAPSVPNPNPFLNQSINSYNYIVDPSLASYSGSTISNQVSTSINTATIDNTNGGGFTKSVDKTTTIVGDTLTYTVVLKNTGSVTANNLVFIDTIPTGSTFVTNSLILNGIVQVGANPSPPTGFTISALYPSQPQTLTFKVLVGSVPNASLIQNTASGTYTYTVNPTLPNGSSSGGNSNTVNTIIGSPLTTTKTVDKSYAEVGDTLTYTVVYTNIGAITAQNIIVNDTLPTATTFIANTFSVNGTIISGASPTVGYNVGNVGPYGVTTVQFKVSVTTLPLSNPIYNTVNSNYSFMVDPSIPPIIETTSATSTGTTIQTAGFQNGFVKSLDKVNVGVGSTITYTLALTNTGNITAQNIIVMDTIPTGTTEVLGSVRVNGTPSIYDVATGVPIGSLSPGATATLTFIVTVTTITSNYLINNQGVVNYSYSKNNTLVNGSNSSNQVTSNINYGNLTLYKTSSPNPALLGSEVIYEIRGTNSGNATLTNVFIIDTLPNCVTYVTNSLTVGGVAQSGSNITTGITIPSIAPNSFITITFKGTVVSVPRGGEALNTAYSNYSYVVDPSLPSSTGTSASNTNILVISNYFNPVKILSPCAICSSFCTIPSSGCSGQSSSSNCLFKNCSNPNISYKVEGICTASEYVCVNSLIAQYKMWQEQSYISTFTTPNTIREVESINGCLSIIRNETIQTPISSGCTNYEGKSLSGYKQIIEGVVSYTIIYITDDDVVCTGDYCELFSAYIVVDPTCIGCGLEVKGCIEDINISELCTNSISLATTQVLYLVPENTACITSCSCVACENITNYVSNSSLCPNISTFLSTGDCYFNEFNVFYTENTGLNIIGILNSINATTSNVEYKMVSTPNPIDYSNEGLALTGNILLVSFFINIRINYVSNDGSNSVRRLNLKVPASSYIVVESGDFCSTKYTISVCIEDIYALGIDGSNIFTNTTLLIKARANNQISCC